MRGILLQSRVGSVLIEPHKSPEKTAGSDKGFDTDRFADLDKDEDHANKEELGSMGAVSMCESFNIRPRTVFALVYYLSKVNS